MERTTGYTMLVHLPDGYKPPQVATALAAKIATLPTLPAALRGSLTWNQGVEMRDWKQVLMATDMAIYFCDPHAPWQRGTNEIPMGCCGSISPRAPTSRCTAQPTWTGSPPSSTTAPEND